jgi:hypothetical protein
LAFVKTSKGHKSKAHAKLNTAGDGDLSVARDPSRAPIPKILIYGELDDENLSDEPSIRGCLEAFHAPIIGSRINIACHEPCSALP